MSNALEINKINIPPLLSAGKNYVTYSLVATVLQNIGKW